ncbi:MAG: hypothetical protein M3P98_00600 [bacterium]|nr:hypothetical protein [bacterium]
MSDQKLIKGIDVLELPEGHKTGQLNVIDHDEFMKNLNKASRKITNKGEKL